MRESRNKEYFLSNANILLLCLLIVFASLSIPSFAQFRGNLDLQAAHSSNVEGSDSASPDNILQPLFDVQYSLPVDRTTIALRVRYQPNYFLKETNRSFHYGHVGLTAATILSAAKESTSLSTTTIDDPTTSRVTQLLDSIVLFSSKDRSLLTTIRALKELLIVEGYSETMKEVIIEELEQAVPPSTSFSKTLNELRNLPASEDYLYLGGAITPSANNTDATLSLVHLMIPDDLGFNSISHNNLYLAEDLSLFSHNMSAPKASITIEGKLQENSKTYESFSYSSVNINPNFTTNVGSVATGMHYQYSNVFYPNDTLFRYNEHRIWADGRFDIAGGIFSALSIGYGIRNYPYPLQDPLTNRILLRAQDKFSQFAFGTSVFFVPTSEITIGIAGKLTFNTNIDSMALSYTVTQVINYAGRTIYNVYAYDLKGIVLALQARTLFDIDCGISLDYEYHRYPIAKTRKGGEIGQIRNDKMYLASASISRPFYPNEERILALFTGITPIIDLTYSKLSSSISSFSYQDFTATLNVSFDF